MRDDVLKRRSKGLPHIDDRKLKIQAMLGLEKNVRGKIHTDIKISFRASNVACFAVGCSHMHYSSLKRLSMTACLSPGVNRFEIPLLLFVYRVVTCLSTVDL